MQISQTNKEGLKYNFKVVVPATDFAKHVNERLAILGKKVKMPGFRPGKVPSHILKQRFAGEATEEALNKVVNLGVDKIIKDHSLRQLNRPSVNIDSFDEDKDVEFTVEVEVFPTIEIKEFNNISLEKLVVTVEDSEVEETLKKDAAAHKKFADLQKDRPAKKGDQVTISCSAMDGKVPFKHIPDEFRVELSDDSFVLFPKLKNALEGSKTGDTITVSEVFEKDVALPEFGGKTLDLTVVVKKIQAPITFSVDADYAKDLGYDTLEELRDAARKSVEGRYQWGARLYLKRHLLDALSNEYSFDLPSSMVEGEFKDIWDRLQSEIKEAREQGTLDPEDDRPEEDLKKEYQAIAERRVRLGLLISEIARLNKIQLTEEELRRAIFAEAMRYPQQMKEVVDFYRKNPNALERLAAPVLEDKVVDFITDAAKVTERQVTIAELKQAVSGVIPGFFDEDEEEPEVKKESKKEKKEEVKVGTEKTKTTKAKGKSE